MARSPWKNEAERLAAAALLLRLAVEIEARAEEEVFGAPAEARVATRVAALAVLKTADMVPV